MSLVWVLQHTKYAFHMRIQPYSVIENMSNDKAKIIQQEYINEISIMNQEIAEVTYRISACQQSEKGIDLSAVRILPIRD